MADPVPTTEVPLLDVRHLSKQFPIGGLIHSINLHALRDVSFSVKRGEVISVVGESGSGKSTTARAVARLIAPTAGEIVFNGVDMLKKEPRRPSLQYRGEVQMVFQDPFGSLNPVHSIGHHLTRPLQIHKKARGRGETREAMHELLRTVGLEPAATYASKFPHQLSGGQRQRVAIARALAPDPKLLLADEPISMLDVSIRMGILNLMERLKHDRGLAYLYITHDLASARYIGDRTHVMYAGRMVEGAPSEELVSRPAHPYTKLLLSAVPDPRGERKRVEARGEVPSLVEPPPGCPFAARCPHVMPVCREVMPGAVDVAPGHWVRCHLYGSGAAHA
ncbi:MAG TPA: ABC transporter ATP-binding protein [Thermomicrobiales bacterium]|jgi:peptide/nickel transport system ATP-binding protein|nr:ABC transporter ATP-binding protein [Thermomicrobiales bacterium]